MIMKLIFVTFTICLFNKFVSSASIECDSNQCKKISNFYHDIGCKAIKTFKSCCPKRFECPDFKKSKDDLTASQIALGCLPIFHKDKESPVDWKCPTTEKEKEFRIIVKRSSPSGNLESFKDEIKNVNEDDETTTLDPLMIESSTTNPAIPTLSLNPFLTPHEGTTIPNDEEWFTKNTYIPTTPTTTSLEETTTTQELIEKQTEMPKIDEPTKIVESSEFSVSTKTEKQNVEIKKDLNLEEMIKTLEEMLTTTKVSMTDEDITTTSAPQKARELDLSEIPRALATSPQKPAILSNSQETVKTTPNELSSILSTLRDIVAKVESLTTMKTEDLPTTTTSIQTTTTAAEEETRIFNEKILVKRSVDDPEEIKQKYSTVKGCSFNGGFYKIGEEILTTDEECLECICEYSPIAHCTLKEECLLA